MSIITIKAVTGSAETQIMLCDMLIETVAAGGSVGFMHPLEIDLAKMFWQNALAEVTQSKRIILGAWDNDLLAGTVTLILDCPPNQPHRAEIAKMMTRISYRGRGIASALLNAAEELAVEHGRTLLVLDTAEDGGASQLHTKQGFQLTGLIPDYALKPHGGLTGTLVYWKRIGLA